MNNFEVVWTERNMVSEKLKYGGCPDLLVRKYNKETDKHEMIMIDFKKAKGYIKRQSYKWELTIISYLKHKDFIAIKQ